MSTMLSVLAGESSIRNIRMRGKPQLGIRQSLRNRISHREAELLGRSFFGRMARKTKNIAKKTTHIALMPTRGITHAALTIARVPVNMVKAPFQSDSSPSMETAAPMAIEQVRPATPAAADMPALYSNTGTVVASPAAPGRIYPAGPAPTQYANSEPAAYNPDYNAGDPSREDEDSGEDDGSTSEETLGSVSSFVRSGTHSVLNAGRKGVGVAKDAQSGLNSLFSMFGPTDAAAVPTGPNWMLIGGIGLALGLTAMVVLKKNK